MLLEGCLKLGQQMKSWMDNIKEWTRMDSPSLFRTAKNLACVPWLISRPCLPYNHLVSATIDRVKCYYWFDNFIIVNNIFASG